MSEEVYRCFDITFKLVGFVVAGGGAVIAYRGLRNQIQRDTRERESSTAQRADDLRWRRAEFMIRLWKEFNDDKSLRPCIQLLDAPGDGSRLIAILLAPIESLNPADLTLRYDFDPYFDFLDSIAYCVDKTPFTHDEAECFGWHFEKVRTIDPVRRYCETNGYRDVVVLADQLEAKRAPGGSPATS